VTRTLSDEAISLIKRWEGLRLSSYECSAGVWTIGYGHTTTARKGQRITEAEANRLLRDDLGKFTAAIDRLVTVPLTSAQFGALVSWCFNVGEAAASSSTLIKKLNRHDYDAVPIELMRWNKVKGRVVDGLTNRRAAEVGLWSRGAFVSSSSVVPEPNPASVAEAVTTDTGRAAIGVGLVGILTQVAPFIESLRDVGPIVGVVIIAAAVGLFIMWRKGRI
jgi:lysozyme